MKNMSIILLAFLVISCDTTTQTIAEEIAPTFSKITQYTYPKNTKDAPFKYRLDYYFDNKKPHRWIELDSNHNVITEYIYEYDSLWNHIGAKYREDGELNYNLERVHFKNDTTKVTQWLDSLGKPYYTMTDYLNPKGKTYRAEFKGNEIHGYDSTFYTKEGFPKRIFFTNTKGKVFNDRTFVYDSISDQKDWITRKKVMNDTVRELHVKETYYNDRYTDANGIFYEGIISTGMWSENTFSFTDDAQTMFVMRTADWDNQFGSIHAKSHGIFTTSTRIPVLDTIYNGAISPSGNKIIYSKKAEGDEFIYLLKKVENGWSEPVNLTLTSQIKGGYFYWLTEKDLFFYSDVQHGNIVQGTLINDQLKITDSLPILNTELGTEFSPYVNREKRFIIFTRYLESDGAQQGFFVSYNLGSYEVPKWSHPKKIKTLPYGWNAYFINDGRQFLYTNGDNIMSVSTKSLNLTYEKQSY
ncbi:hypothetical protein KORDIASMS9_02227 [Kordia sp. SMS9]|uniref:hypothetical protein n=1 Tax=Kordia sp. SMS9 TaxID=2282170 RepID=UPI000E0DB751|nr:hypothetical protein [Kordia sp. SMS9]AXG69998.1 hypothetical protein KORDIASMS9_02227 [Kordia sp. SMS9]